MTLGHWRLRSIVRLGIIGILLAFVIWGIVYIVRTKLRVREIQFIASDMHLEVNERLLSTNLLFFPSAKIRQDLLHAYPQFKDMRIVKKFPDTIQIMPVLRTPFLVIETPDLIYTVDEEGVVVDVGVVHPTIVTLRIDLPPLQVGTVVKDQRVQSVIAFFSGTRSLLPIRSFTANPDGSGIRAKSGETDILFSQNSDMTRTIATLQTITAGVRIKGTMPVLIDVRFTKPVIQW